MIAQHCMLTTIVKFVFLFKKELQSVSHELFNEDLEMVNSHH